MKPNRQNAASSTGALTPVPSAGAGQFQAPASQLVDSFFKNLDPKTVRTYTRHLEDFRLWMKASSIQEAAGLFLSQGQGQANLLSMNWKAQLVTEKYAPSSINGHLTALRSLVKMARILGMVPWSIEVPNVTNEAYRDTTGPGTDRFIKVMKDLESHTDAMGIRDRAILAILHDGGLRRDEAASLHLEHVDFEGHRVWVKAKMRSQRVEIPVNADVERCLHAWIKVRGEAPGPLFKNFDPAGKGEGLSGSSIARISHKYGLGNPHGLRHLAITEALDATGGDLRKVMKFSRHKDPKTLMIYDDKRKNVSGEISAKLADLRNGKV